MADHRTLDQLETEILSLPPAVTREYQRAREALAPILSEQDLRLWMTKGAQIAQQSFRAWEATAEYFRVSAAVLNRTVPLQELETWADYGRHLAATSAPIAISYFRSSPLILTRLSLEQLELWAGLGKRLYRGTWKSAALSTHFLDSSYALLRYMPLEDLDQFVTFLDLISQRSNDLAEECLNISESAFANTAREDTRPFLSLLQQTAQLNWKYAKETMQAGPLVLKRIHPVHRSAFLAYAASMVSEVGRTYLSFMLDGSHALEKLHPDLHGLVLEMFDGLWHTSTRAAVEFLKSAPPVLSIVDQEALLHWYSEGARYLRDNEAAGISFFKLESGRGDQLLQSLSSTMELEGVLPILRMYGRALTGSDLNIQSNANSTERRLGWVSAEQAATDGRSIFLPPQVKRFRDKEKNFSWYKVITTHQAGHLEFYSFDFTFERDGSRFPTWRVQIEAPGEGRTAFVPFQRFFDLFDDRQLASDIFAIVEDARVDFLVTYGYAGLRSVYQDIRTNEVRTRPSPEELPLREALMEILVRMTLLESPETVPVPDVARPVVERTAAILRHLRAPDATVEDAAEATLRIYRIFSQVPNQTDLDTNWQDVDVDDLGQDTSTPDNTSATPEEAGTADQIGDLGQFVPNQGEGSESLYESPELVDYRGDFKPELTQVVANLRQTQQDDGQTGGGAIDEESLRRLAEQSAEIDLDDVVEGDIEQGAGTFVSQLLNEYLNEQEKKDAQAQKRRNAWKPSQDGPLEEEEATFLYDEWDFKANDYKPRWCRVREVSAESGTMEFYSRTLEHHAMLVSRIRRQFEMMIPEMYKKMRRLPDGEEFELDAVVDALVHRRAGAPVSDKIYSRRTKIQRDVAVIFLLDMSASTAEAIDEKATPNDDWRDIPDDPREYLFWLRARREAAKKNYKRIIDIERESTVLLIRALETIGDQYGIYGFSGYGRENVEFYTIKDIDETFSDAVPRRIDAISPLHATRMGPAIRHATAKLKEHSAKTRMLFLISDGRPQDRGYSREGVEKEYAVQDTHKALLEARSNSITPFCLTVDRAGHEYMKEMCGDIAYEILEDVTGLPERLPQIYRRLTI